MADYKIWTELVETYQKYHGEKMGLWALSGALSNYLTDEQVKTIITNKIKMEEKNK